MCLRQLRPGSVTVESLNDDESEILAESKPHLKALLFGADQVKEIVRRPFFAKILDQSYVVDPDGPPPQSEVDLIENWWDRGGYGASGARRDWTSAGPSSTWRAFRARNLSDPIGLVPTRRIYRSDNR